MQTKKQYINLYFTTDDKEILAWANMIRESNFHLSTWIQAILVAEIAGEDLNIGAIYTPPYEPPYPLPNSNLLGDDTHLQKASSKSGWNVRGQNGKLKEGSILSIKVTRPIVQDAICIAKKTHNHLGAYIKTLIRKKLKNNPAKINLLPNKTDVFDLFVLCEGKNRQNLPETTLQNKNTLNQKNKKPSSTPLKIRYNRKQI